MVKTQKLTPEVYYKRSRDFQLLGRTFDFLINYLKTNADLVNNVIISDTLDPQLLDLAAATLGFKKAHEYNSAEMRAFCSCFSSILRRKGTKKSIEDALKMIVHAQGIEGEVRVITSSLNRYCLYIFVPEKLTELALFEDILNYIIPAGMSYRIVYQNQISGSYPDYYIETSAQKGDVKHTMIQSQIKKIGDDDLLPEAADIAAGRIDNLAMIPALESGEDISDYVQVQELDSED